MHESDRGRTEKSTKYVPSDSQSVFHQLGCGMAGGCTLVSRQYVFIGLGKCEYLKRVYEFVRIGSRKVESV